MAAIPINLIVEQKADFEATFTISGANNVAFDLTNFRQKQNQEKLYIFYVNKLCCCIPRQDCRKVEIDNDSFNTSMLKEGRYVYDIVITNSVGGAKRRVVEGQVTVTPGVT